jgi:hypothetical protein
MLERLIMLAVLCGLVGCTGPLIYRPPKKVITVVKVVEKHPLPPLPDRKKNNATVAGIDTTGLGIRDDVHIWIFTDYSSSAKRDGLVGMGKTLQKLLVQPAKTREAAEKLRKELQDDLLVLKRIPGIKASEAEDLDAHLYFQTMNTQARLKEYLRYNNLLTGGR